MKENQLLVINSVLSIDQRGIETVVNFILVIVMFQGSGKLANPVNRMIFPRHRVSLVVEQSRQGFADSVVAQAYREPPTSEMIPLLISPWASMTRSYRSV